ncbi:MAG: CapA family protein [Solirubrobacterales bacterium]
MTARFRWLFIGLAAIGVIAGSFAAGYSFHHPSPTGKNMVASLSRFPGFQAFEAEAPAAVPEVLPKRSPAIQVTIHAAGDCTLGNDDRTPYPGSFRQMFDSQKDPYAYFFAGLQSLFQADDLTIVNCETSFTDAEARYPKDETEATYFFRAPASHVQILRQGGVDAASIANNHTFDFLQRGRGDTIQALERAGIPAFGYNRVRIVERKGLRFGLVGFSITGPAEKHPNLKAMKRALKSGIENASGRSDIVVVSFHWGEEHVAWPNRVQKELGRAAVDYGADLVLGHHPHVMQGVESYKGRTIVYSLGNLCFGGSRNPHDKDTFVYQQSFAFYPETRLVRVLTPKLIPCSISSSLKRNDFRPRLLTGSEALRVTRRLDALSFPYSAEMTRQLIRAVQAGNAAAIPGLLNRGADPNALVEENRAVLALAAARGDSDTVQALLSGGADPEPPVSVTSPLVAAARTGSPEVVRILLTSGADPNRITGGVSAIEAAQDPSIKCILIQHVHEQPASRDV